MSIRNFFTLALIFIFTSSFSNDIRFSSIKLKLTDVYADKSIINLENNTKIFLIDKIVCHDCLGKLNSMIEAKDNVIIVHIIDSELYDNRVARLNDINAYFSKKPLHYFLSLEEFEKISDGRIIQTPYLIKYINHKFTYLDYNSIFIKGCK